MNKSLNSLKEIFEQYLESHRFKKAPAALYEPNNYILDLGGKRLRPTLVLMACDLFGGVIEKALPAALTIEFFHSFSLIHDDIIDEAEIRRGQPTVHKKYNTNDAILSGDVLLIYAYKYLTTYDASLQKQLITDLTETAIEVCEGQSMDTSFESRNDVLEAEYIEMIRLKTAVLLAASLRMGAIIGGAGKEETDLLYAYGENLGVAFQIQDDILDTFGGDLVGKQIGGDILQNKKTLLLIRAQEMSKKNNDTSLSTWLNKSQFNSKEKINAVKQLFDQYEVLKYAEAKRDSYVQKAITALRSINQPAEPLEALIDALVMRTY
ncbi:MAG: polyprenyl synthetase family protein [Bacteroidetes bacterium]|nr:polyprenyl synthetase family protein [Bacteroidota bacterium]